MLQKSPELLATELPDPDRWTLYRRPVVFDKHVDRSAGRHQAIEGCDDYATESVGRHRPEYIAAVSQELFTKEHARNVVFRTMYLSYAVPVVTWLGAGVAASIRSEYEETIRDTMWNKVTPAELTVGAIAIFSSLAYAYVRGLGQELIPGDDNNQIDSNFFVEQAEVTA